MPWFGRILSGIAVVAAVAVFSSRVSAETYRHPLLPYGSFELELPDEWRATHDDETGALLLDPGSGEKFQLLITPEPMGASDPRPRRDARAFARGLARELARGAERENGIRLQGISERDGPFGVIAYYQGVDGKAASGSPDDYRHMTQGVGIYGGLLAKFTVLTDDPRRGDHAVALELLRTAQHGTDWQPVPEPGGRLSLGYPGRSWEFQIDLPGFTVSPVQQHIDGYGLHFAARHESGVLVTVYLERASRQLTSREQREHVWRILEHKEPAKSDPVRWERGGTAVLEYDIEELGGQRLEQHHLNAHHVRDGVWIDVHLSKQDYDRKDRKRFRKIVRSIRFSD